MEDVMEKLHFYKLLVEFNEELGGHEEAGFIATEVDYLTVCDRLDKAAGVKKFEVDEVNQDNLEFPVNLIEVNQTYESFEELKKDYMVSKLSGVI